jgi:microsomal prostaglandin-E synthase 2
MNRLRGASALVRASDALARRGQTSTLARATLAQREYRSSGGRPVGSHAAPRADSVNRALLLCTSTALVSWNALARPLHADAIVAAPAAFDAAEFRTGFVAPVKRVAKEEMRITLYQYEVCPFCNKVRAFLDYHKVPYRVVEVDPMSKAELGKFSRDYRKVPIAIVNDMQVNGSGAIIDAVTVTMDALAEKPTASVQRDHEWSVWVDDHLIHLISPNIYGTMTESLQAFEYIVDNAKFSAWQRMSIRYSGSAAMYMVGKKIKKKYNIEKPREEMYEAINKWTDAVEAEGGRFLGGDSPGTADLAVFGVLRAISKFDTFADIKKNCPAFEPWFLRTRDAVGEDSIVERL